jgi:hypothetical protein
MIIIMINTNSGNNGILVQEYNILSDSVPRGTLHVKYEQIVGYGIRQCYCSLACSQHCFPSGRPRLEGLRWTDTHDKSATRTASKQQPC